MSVADMGRDTSCTSTLRTGRFVTKAQLVGESAYRRLTTPRGMLRGGEEEANFGLDLLGMIGSGTTKADAASLGGRVRSELSKDERILSADVNVTVVTEGPVTSFVITVLAKTTEGPFELAIRASEVTVQLLGIKAES